MAGQETKRMPAARRRTNYQHYTSGDNDTLRRLEDSLSQVATNFATQRDDVSSLKAQMQHLQGQQAHMAQEWKSDLENITAGFRNDMSRFNVALEQVVAKIEAKRVPSSVLVGMATAGLLAIGMLTGLQVFFVNAEIAGATGPLANTQAAQGAQLSAIAARMGPLEVQASNSTQADNRSQQDRADINRRTNEMSDRIARNEAGLSAIHSSLVEVETQFSGVKQILYFLWDKVMGTPLPIVPRNDPAYGNK